MSTANAVLMYLSSYGLKREGTGKYRTTKGSPLRSGSNSDAFTLTIDDDEHGAFTDHRSGETGSLYDLATRLSIPIEKRERNPVASTKRGYRDLADYAAAHGLTADALMKAGWSDVQMKKDGDRERPALSFKTATGTRYRFIDGDKSFYKSDYGYKACWYGLQKAVLMAQEHSTPLVICNGEVSTVAAQACGVPACCVTGGEKRIPDDLLSQLHAVWQGEIYLALDCDDTGRRAASEIRSQLVGYTAHVIDLGLTDGGDLADFCMLHTVDSRAALTKLVTPAIPLVTGEPEAGDGLRVLAAALRELQTARRGDSINSDPITLLKKARTEIAALEAIYMPPQIAAFPGVAEQAKAELAEAMANPGAIRGLTTDMYDLDSMIGGWRNGWVVMVYGATGMGKSTLCVSALRTWLNYPGLIVPTESSPLPYFQKIAACVQRIPMDKITDGNLTPDEKARVDLTYTQLGKQMSQFLDNTSPTPAQLSDAVRRGVEERGIRWVIVDSVSKMHAPGAVSKTESIAIAQDTIQDLAAQYQIPFLVTTQVGRQIRDRQNKRPRLDDAADTSQTERNADVILTIYNHDYYVRRQQAEPDPELPPGTALITVEKHRWRDAGDVAVMLKFVGGSGFYSLAREGEVEF